MDNIRNASLKDLPEIQDLLKQLGYDRTIEFLQKKVSEMLSDSSYRLLVYELDGKAVALMTIHYYWQIGYEGETANVGFFVVDENYRGRSIGAKMDNYCFELANLRGCSMIELYSSEKRLDAHRFYERQGYKSYEKFFMKPVIEEL